MTKLSIGLGTLAAIISLAVVLEEGKVASEDSQDSFATTDIEPIEVVQVEYLEFEPIEIYVPLTVLDFTNEEPTLITPIP